MHLRSKKEHEEKAPQTQNVFWNGQVVSVHVYMDHHTSAEFIQANHYRISLQPPYDSAKVQTLE